MFKRFLSQSLFSRPSLSTPLTTPPLRPFTTTITNNMPLITSTGKPRIILGTMTFGPDESEGARITDINDYNKILDRFQSAGYNEIDTARVYVGGKQEAFTREAQWKERGLTCATKWYPHTPGAHKPEVIEEKLNESLKELGTDCIDIFYLHAADRSVPFQQTLQKLNELHKQGKFVQLGLSNFTAFEVAEVVMHCKYNNWVRPTIYQGMVSRRLLLSANVSSQSNTDSHHTVQRNHPLHRSRTNPHLPPLRPRHRSLQPSSRRSLQRKIQNNRRTI
jgi:diketogulonate reductase-like aldo/keto reductase